MTNYKIDAKCLRCGINRFSYKEHPICVSKITRLRHKWDDGDHSRSYLTRMSKDELKFKSLYKNIRYRCERKKNKDYPRYGGAGIKFLWPDYESFKLDMYEDYLQHRLENGNFNTTIERFDNSGHYCKENCRWATWKEQARNKSQNKFLTYKGETLCLADWANRLGCDRAVINYRVRAGWKTKDIIEVPVNHSNCHKKYYETV